MNPQRREKREKSLIYCGKSSNNSVVCGAAWIEFENELRKGSSDAICSRISAFSVLCENRHGQHLAAQHGKERDQQNPKYTAAWFLNFGIEGRSVGGNSRGWGCSRIFRSCSRCSRIFLSCSRCYTLFFWKGPPPSSDFRRPLRGPAQTARFDCFHKVN